MYVEQYEDHCSVGICKGMKSAFLVWGSVFLGIGVCLAVLWLVWPTKSGKVYVYGSFLNVSQEELRGWISDYLRTVKWKVDVEKVERILRDKSWIRKVSVKQRFWGDLVVELDEYEPIAQWRKGRLLSREGIFVKPSNMSPFAELPLLVGLDNQVTELLYQYFSINRLLVSSGLVINRLELKPWGGWVFGINGVEVFLGREMKIERLKGFIRFYHAFLVFYWDNVSSIDLRYLSGVSVVWKNQSLKPDI